jgi:hypothetical protein
MTRSVLGFLIKLITLTLFFTSLLIALFGVSTKKLAPNSHLDHKELDTETQLLPSSHRQPHSLISNPEFAQDLDNLLELEHRDAYVDTLKTKNRCHLDQELCNKITRASDYHSYQKMRFQTLTIGLINSLDNLIQEGNTSKECLHWLKLYKDDIAARGSATHTTIKMNTHPVESYREYWQVLTHELGHIIDLCGLDDNTSRKHSSFTEFGEKAFGVNDPSLNFYSLSRESERVRKKWSSAQDFISGYASKNPFEDFAESQQAYLNHPRKFLELAEQNSILMKKYNFFKHLYNNTTFDITEYPEKVSSLKTRVWDTTRWE